MDDLYRLSEHPPQEILTKSDQRDMTILQLVEEAEGPMGSGTLAEELSRQGKLVGSATAGRWLRELEVRGYLQRVGRQGRIITDLGREYLMELRASSIHWETANQMANVLRSLDERRLLDILVARKALEAEASALAAHHMTETKRHELTAIVEASQQANNLKDHAHYDLAFHFAVADGSENKVLAAAVRMIRSVEPRFPVYAHIRRSLGRRSLVEHSLVCEAVVAGNADMASQLMGAHIGAIIEDVHTYWQAHADTESITDPQPG